MAATAADPGRHRSSERSRTSTGTGLSATASTFGAKVSVGMNGGSLFFVVGRDDAPDTIVEALGGRVVTHLPDRRKVLALAPLETYTALRAHPGLALAGPVGVDPERFGRFARLIGLDAEPSEAQRPP